MNFKHIKINKLTTVAGLSLFAIIANSTVNAQTYNLQKRNTEFSIDGNNGAVQRQQVYLWETNLNNRNQQWQETDLGNGYYSYQKQNTNMCLDGGNNGAQRQAVILWPCDEGNRNQHWRKVATANNSYRLEKRNSPGFSIDGNRGADYRQGVYLWNSDNNNINQQWVFSDVSNPETTTTGNASNCTGTFDLPACMERTADNGGGTITLAAKTYRLSESLRLRDNVNIVGQGKDTIIRFADDVADSIDEPLLLGLGVNNIELKDFTLRCSIDQNPNSKDFRNDHMGVFMDGPGDPANGERTNNNNVRMERIEAYYCSNGMHLKGLTGFTAVDLDLHHNGNTLTDLFHNMYLLRVADIHVAQTQDDVGGFYASNRGHGLRLGNIGNAYFGNLAVFDNADHGVHMTTETLNTRFYNLRNRNNCANSSGACGEFRTYSGAGNVNENARFEPIP